VPLHSLRRIIPRIVGLDTVVERGEWKIVLGRTRAWTLFLLSRLRDGLVGSGDWLLRCAACPGFLVSRGKWGDRGGWLILTKRCSLDRSTISCTE
jgi:hypothetical protein